MAKVVNPRAIKRKIRSVQNIRKITKAMEMVSAAKLRRVQGRLQAIRPYANKIREMLRDLTAQAGEIEIPLLKPRPQVRRVAYVVFTADKGLCGAYNANVLRLVTRTVDRPEDQVRTFAIGRKGADFLRKRGPAPAGRWIGLPVEPSFKQIREMTQAVIGAYRREEVDEVHLVYTEFVSAARYTPRVLKFLPMETKAAEEAMAHGKAGAASKPAAGATAGGKKVEAPYGYIFEPDPATILKQLIPRYVEILFYRILLEAAASEHAARMTAMHSATNNAEDLIKSLTLTYNKARQASITKELLDIVGGAEALKG